MNDKPSAESLDPAQCAEALAACACSNLRRATRVVTQHFDEALAPSGIRSTQLVVLLAIASGEVTSISALARELDMDASTLNRNLRPLEKEGWIQIEQTPGRQRRTVRMTRLGHEVIGQAAPLWQAAQGRLVSKLGKRNYQSLVGGLAEISRLARGEV